MSQKVTTGRKLIASCFRGATTSAPCVAGRLSESSICIRAAHRVNRDVARLTFGSPLKLFHWAAGVPPALITASYNDLAKRSTSDILRVNVRLPARPAYFEESEIP